jgi:DNA-binding response OmpR family regulator
MSNFYDYTILLIKNNPDIRFKLCEFLEEQGYRVIESETAPDSKKKGFRNLPDLIIIELNLPAEEVISSIYQIRRSDPLSKIPILASSYDGRLGIELFSKIEEFGDGPIEYIAQPSSLSRFTEQIEMILPNRKKAA